ncbi:uncharacterized protein [Porites lutea]|uniref:uncharacterized protein n=1 Tax=Porites lutea TaxID=51062 RepID=UPI003CC6B5E1
MRLKRRNEKGEIFRKSLRSERGSDSDDIEEISSDAENHRKTKERKTDEDAVRESSERGRKESRKKQMTSSHHRKGLASRDCTSKNRHTERRSKRKSPDKEDRNSRKQHHNNSKDFIISKNRITRSLGIYNKAKRSDTVMRENLKKKFCKKKFEDIKTQTARDMARVLDCSSFKLESPSWSAGLLDGQDSPDNSNFPGSDQLTQSPSGSNRTHSSCSSTGKYSNPEKCRITPLRRITPHRITPHNETALAFKTPLQEISQTLTGMLNPSETFHGRNYLAELQGQLRKMYKQSSVSSQAQRISNRICIASEVQKRCLKRKSEGTYNFITLNFLLLQDKYVSGVSNRERKILDDEKENDLLYARDVQRCLFEQPDAPSQTERHTLVSTQHNSSFDILDFLDGVDHESDISGETQAHRDYMTPDPKLVSPPKKPALDSPTPEKKFYPHKLF